MIKNPNWQEATSGLVFTSVAEDFNSGGWLITNPSSGQSATRTWDRRIASQKRWPLGQAASFAFILVIENEVCTTKVSYKKLFNWIF